MDTEVKQAINRAAQHPGSAGQAPARARRRPRRWRRCRPDFPGRQRAGGAGPLAGLLFQPRRAAGAARSSTPAPTKLVTSGRIAIALALRQMGIGPGDAVLVPSFHCASMIEPVTWSGATPVFYRINADTSVDLDDIAAKLDGTSKVLMVDQLLRLPAGPVGDPRVLRQPRPADAGRLRPLLPRRAQGQTGRLLRRLCDRQQHEVLPDLRRRRAGLGAPFAGAGGAALGRRRFRSQGGPERAGRQLRLRPPGPGQGAAVAAAGEQGPAVAHDQGAQAVRHPVDGARLVRRRLQFRPGLARQALVDVFALRC